MATSKHLPSEAKRRFIRGWTLNDVHSCPCAGFVGGDSATRRRITYHDTVMVPLAHILRADRLERKRWGRSVEHCVREVLRTPILCICTAAAARVLPDSVACRWG